MADLWRRLLLQPKPDRSGLDEKINKLQTVVDAQKRTADRITKVLSILS